MGEVVWVCEGVVVGVETVAGGGGGLYGILWVIGCVCVCDKKRRGYVNVMVRSAETWFSVRRVNLF